jgi:DNA-binding response OmpR family regulator
MLGMKESPQANAKRLLRVLVADDNRDTTDSMTMLIRLWGHDVRPVFDAAAVLEQALAYRPDVLLLDIAMPGVDGFALARELRRESLFREVILIAVTGYADDPHRLAGVQAGFDLYLVKPVNPEIVKEILTSHLNRAAKSPEVGALGAAEWAEPGLSLAPIAQRDEVRSLRLAQHVQGYWR